MPRKAPTVTIIELKSKAEFSAIYPLIKQINQDMKKSEFNQMLKDMMAQGYRCVGAYKGKKLVGVCGLWIITRFWCGRYIEIDNLVVDKNMRSKGIGALLLKWVEKEAKKQKAHHIGAASYSTEGEAHRFYFKEKFIILGFYFARKLRRSR